MAKQAISADVEALITFLDTASETGKMKPATAHALKMASKRVLEVLTPAEKSDLEKVDIDKVLDTFKQKKGKGLREGSLKTYLNRTKRAYTEFSAYRQDPQNWQSSIAPRNVKSKAGSKAKAGTVKAKGPGRPKGKRGRKPAAPVVQAVAVDVPPITHQYPLRQNETVKISGLPRDLKVTEAKRIAAFLYALCDDFKPNA